MPVITGPVEIRIAKRQTGNKYKRWNRFLSIRLSGEKFSFWEKSRWKLLASVIAFKLLRSPPRCFERGFRKIHVLLLLLCLVKIRPLTRVKFSLEEGKKVSYHLRSFGKFFEYRVRNLSTQKKLIENHYCKHLYKLNIYYKLTKLIIWYFITRANI